MDLNTVTSVVEVPSRAEQATWQPGDAWLAGGTWLFSEPQPQLRRLIDLRGFGWAPFRAGARGLDGPCTAASFPRSAQPAAG